jgi:valyl-tRNA synthetase
MMNLDGKTPQQLGKPTPEALELCDRWILSRFHQVVRQTKERIQTYGLGEAAQGLYEFIWGDFCDWYIELVKSRLWDKEQTNSRLVAQQTLAYVLEGILKLLHPFMPHITEEIWQTLTQATDEVLALQAYPEVDASAIAPDLEKAFDLLFGTVRTIRNLRATLEIKQGAKVAVILQTESAEERSILESGKTYIQTLPKVENLTITPTLNEEIGQVIAGVFGTVQILIPLTGIVDIEALHSKLEKNLSKVEGEIESLTSRLNNPNFVNKARPEVVEGAREALAEAQKQAEILRSRLQHLKGL